MKIAAIDIGTNSIHMVVVRIDRTPCFEVVDREKEMVGLGKHGLHEGRLTEKAMQRGIEALASMKELSIAHDCEYLVAAATSAVREAGNRDDFLYRIEKEVGIKVRVLSGEEEAELIFRAVRDGTDLSDRKALVIDLGGGSTEFVLGNNFGIHLRESLPIGVVRFTDEFAENPGVTSPKRYKALAKKVRALAGPALERARGIGFDEVVMTSGTAKQLGDLLPRGPDLPFFDAMHVPPMDLASLEELTENLQAMDRKARGGLNRMNPRRSGNIAIGATIVRELVRLTGVAQVTLSNRALRDGLVLETVKAIPDLAESMRSGPGLRERSIRHLARIHPGSVEHGRHVAGLAAQIFDQSGGLHGLGAAERELLGFAAQIHDVGLVIGYSRHHKHSYYIITNAELPGFDTDEILELALICRYHRRSMPRSSHLPFKSLEPARAQAVETLAGILRVADALDRTHQGQIDRITMNHEPDRITLEVQGPAPCPLELKAAERKTDLLERVWGKPVAFAMGVAQPRVQPQLEFNSLG